MDIIIAGARIPSHFIFEVAAFYCALNYYFSLSKKLPDPLSEHHRWIVIIAGAVGALIGSRLLAALEQPSLFFHPPSFLFYYQNQTVAGGILGAIIGVEIIKKIIGEKKRSGDLFVYPLMLGIMIGRIGCALTGVKDGTAGLPSSLPWAFDQGDGIHRHPTALYEIVYVGIIWLCLRYISKTCSLASGTLFRIFIICYAGFRFFIEFIKPIQPLIFHISAIQLACLFAVLYYAVELAIHTLHRPQISKRL